MHLNTSNIYCLTLEGLREIIKHMETIIHVHLIRGSFTLLVRSPFQFFSYLDPIIFLASSEPLDVIKTRSPLIGNPTI